MPKEADIIKVQRSLRKDSFESCILEGFDIFALLNQLAEVLPPDREKLKRFEQFAFYRSFL